MENEPTQDEDGLPAWERDALEALRWDWDTAYLIGHDDERGWWAARRDRIGGLLTAADPYELRQAISGDYAVRPVPRESPADADPGGADRALGTDPGALLTGSAEP